MQWPFTFKHAIAFGILIRLVLMPFFGHPFDMFAWYTYIENILENGVSLSVFDIKPVWKLFLIQSGYIYDWFSKLLLINPIPVSTLPANFDPSYGITVITDPLFNIIVKTPLIIADIVSAFIIYKFVFYYSKDYVISKQAALLYFCSPIVIWISAAWGQYDSLAVLFTLLSFYLLLVRKKIFFSSLALYLAMLVKIYPIIFLIPIIISIWRFDKDRFWKISRFLVLLFPIILYLVLFQGILLLEFFNGQIIPQFFLFTIGFGLTYWSAALFLPISPFWAGLTANIIMLILLSISSYYLIKKSKTRFETIIFGSILYTISVFLAVVYVPEQRSLILLSLLSLAIIKWPKVKYYSILLSVIAFFYAQKNFPYYLLPIASRFPDYFRPLFSSASYFAERTSTYLAPNFIGGLILFVLGLIFSVIILRIFIKIFRTDNISLEK